MTCRVSSDEKTRHRWIFSVVFRHVAVSDRQAPDGPDRKGTIAGLTLDRIRVSDAGVELRFTSEWLPVPELFASLLRDWTANRTNLQSAAHKPDSPWLFPGAMPGQHVLAAHISEKLKRHWIPAQLGRSAAWRHMVRDAPPSVLAEMLGLSPATAMRHADLAGANFTRYVVLQHND